MTDRMTHDAVTPGLIVIGGPTATGKSDQALRLAQKLGSPLLSADSRQIYWDFDIGTAKPTPADRAQWPHHLIDIADPRETFTVAEYQIQAQRLIDQAHQQGQTPVLVGGTGLYIQAMTAGLTIPKVPPHPELRQQLQDLPQHLCYQWLQQLDPDSSTRIHLNDRVRTLRALEVFYTTGQPASQQQTTLPPAFPILLIGLNCSMDRLRARIAQRTRHMLARGWIDEVKALQEKYGADLPLLQTLGYGELSRYLAGAIDLEQAEHLIIQHTRQFAKRQLTWFRRTPDLIWLDCGDPTLEDQIWALVTTRLK